MITRIYPYKIPQQNYIITSATYSKSQSSNELNDRRVLDLPRYYYGLAFTGVGMQNKLEKLDHVNCPICGYEMMPEEKYNQLLERSQNLSNVYSVLQILKENQQYIKPPFDRLMQKTEEVADKDPERRMHDYAFSLKKDAVKYFKELVEKQNAQMDKEALSEGDRKIFEDFKVSADALLKNPKTVKDSIKEFNQLISNTFKVMENPKNMKFLVEYRKLLTLYYSYNYSVNTIPYSNVGLDVVKNVFGASKTNSYLLVLSDEDGTSTILTCADCLDHTRRINKGLFITPEINANYLKYVDSVSRAIAHTEDESLFVYPKRIIALISKITNGYMKADRMSINKEMRQKDFDISRFEFNMANVEDIPCPVCNSTMFTHDKRVALNEKLMQKMSVAELVNVVKEHYNYVHPRYKILVDEFLKIVDENPNYNHEKVYKVMTENYNRKIISINKWSLSKVKNITEGMSMSRQDKYLVDSYISQMEDNIKNNRILSVQEYKELVGNSLLLIKDKKLWDWTVKVAGTNKTWHLYNGASALCVPDFISNKFPSKLSAAIDSIFRDTVITGDHLVARSQDGTNQKSNILPMCKRCNHAKQNKSFDIWASRNPQILEYVPKTLRYIEEKMKKGEAPNDESYIEEILATLNGLAEQYHLADIHFSL